MNISIRLTQSPHHPWQNRILLALIFCAAAACIAVRPGIAAQGTPATGIEVRQLSNGLTVIVEQRPDALVTGVSLVVRAGSRDDPEDRPNAIATLAGAVLQGTEDRPTESSLTAEIDEIAGGVDLSVDPDLIHYTVQVPNGEVRPVLDMLSDAMLHPRFGVAGTADAFEDAVFGEVTPFPSELAARLWPDHPAGRSLAGLDDEAFDQAVSAVTYRDLLALHDRYFVARNMVLSIVGPVDAAATVTLANQFFGPLRAGERQPIVAVPAGPPRAGRTTAPSILNQGLVMVAFPTVGLLSPDEPAVAMLGVALGGASGRLFQDLRIEQRLAYMVDGEAFALFDVGALAAVALVSQEDVEATVAQITDVFAELRRRPPDDAELARLRQRMRGEFLIGREPAAAAAGMLGTNAMLGLPIDPAEYLARFEAVTADDLRRVAGEYLLPERAVTLVMVEPSPDELATHPEAIQ
jgi:predicted Zn-dependent peptidase